MEATHLTPAERMYRQHLKNVSDYQRRHPEKMRQKNKERLEKIKADPEAYEEYKRRRRAYDKKFRESKKGATAPTPSPVDSDSGGEEPSKDLVAQIREDNAENFQEDKPLGKSPCVKSLRELNAMKRKLNAKSA